MSSSVWGDSGRFLDELNDETGEGTEHQQQDEWKSGRDGVIFLIDCTKPMFIENSDGESPFNICLKCAKNTLMGKIISSDKDLVAIVFFGTEKFKNTNDFKNIYVYQELDMPDADRIKDLENQMQAKENEFKEKYGHCEDFFMSDALWACSNIFANCSYNLASKRVMLFTNTDDPHQNNPEIKRRALRKAKDLEDLGIFIDLMHMQQPGKSFDVSKFYKDIIYSDEDDDPNLLVDPSEKFEEMLARVQCKDYKKRATTRIPLRFPGGLQLGVSVFTLCRPAVKSSYVKVDSRSNEEVKTVTKMICEDTGQELMPTDVKYSQEFGGTKINFEKNEIQNIKSFGETGLHLLGFKPRSSMKPYFYVKPGQFIYPDESATISRPGMQVLPQGALAHTQASGDVLFVENDCDGLRVNETISGSKNLFSALLKRCLARNVIPICMYIPRTISAPRLVALIAQKEELDERGLQIRPSGFCLTFLPFSDDIRKLKLEETPKATNTQIDKAKEIVDKLKFKFSSDNFENPNLQLFYRTLEALALDRDDVEPINDTTVPKTDVMEEKAGKIMEEFKSLVFPDGYNETVGKRKANTSGTAAKKPKIELSEIDMRKEATSGSLNKFTVAILKDFCQSNKLKPSSTKKANLIEAIKNHFQVS